jgi:hypothetical protein
LCPDWKTRIGEDVTSKILDRVQGATKKNTSETLVLQRYAEIVPSVNRTAVIPPNRNRQTLRSCQKVRATTQALDVERTIALAEPLPPNSQGLGEPQSQRTRFPQTRFHPPHAENAMQSLMKSPDGL